MGIKENISRYKYGICYSKLDMGRNYDCVFSWVIINLKKNHPLKGGDEFEYRTVSNCTAAYRVDSFF